jgi:hypothetical protein
VEVTAADPVAAAWAIAHLLWQTESDPANLSDVAEDLTQAIRDSANSGPSAR